MSVTTEDDPVEAMLDILDNGTWSNATKPPRIARSESYTPSDKKQYVADDAVYVYQTGEASIAGITGQFSVYETAVSVTLDMWSPTSAAQAFALYQDATGIVAGYANDNAGTTPFGRIRPTSPMDLRHERHTYQGAHWRYNLDVRMVRTD